MRREFKYSFRSGANVLDAVDAVFAPPEMCDSVTSDAHIPPQSVESLWDPPALEEALRLKEKHGARHVISAGHQNNRMNSGNLRPANL